MEHRKLRMGMIGGGSGGFIGAVHRSAAFLDNHIELVCGCFSADPAISHSSGRSYYLPEERIYDDYRQMFDREMALPVDRRMDFVSIVTPNHLHFEPAMMALERGFHVVLDKPMTFSLDEARLLRRKVAETGLTFALTHVYTGYPAVKEARARIIRGDLGKVRRVYVEYPQGWLADRIELHSGNNAGWRTDPARSGKGGCTGDIGTHAWHLAEYVTGLRVTELCGELTSFAPGRPIDDDCAAFLHFEGGAKGVLMATQIAAGEANNIRVRVYGERGGLEWRQEDPNFLVVKWLDRPHERLMVGTGFMGATARWNTRTPAGHPEGFIEAFANIYRNFALTVMARQRGEQPTEDILDFPTADDGLRGMQFIETMVAAGRDDSRKWVEWIEE
jgi:predicted dehydrogenase